MSRFTAFPGKYGFLSLVVFALLSAIVSISLGTAGTFASDTNQAPGVLTGDRQFTFVVDKIAPSPVEDADIKNSPVFANFDNWIKQYNSRSSVDASQNNELGKELAIKRRQILKELIQKDPQAALEKAIPPETRNSLPSFVAEYAEKSISANGDFLVFETDETDAASKQMNGSHLEYKVVVGNSVYRAFVYGRRAAMTSKLNIPLRGIILDDAMAVDEQPLRKLDRSEYESHQVDSAKVDENGVAAEVGGELRYFSGEAELDNFIREQIEWESKIGPVRTKENLSVQEPASAWTEGAKTVLVIRVDFPDKPGDPVDYYNQAFTEAEAQSMFVSEISPFYVNNSYGKTSLAPTVTTVVRMPQPQTFYTQGGNYYNLLTDARAAALSAGFDTNNFDLDVVAFSYTSGFGWAGISGVGYKGSLINGAFSLPVFAHELGHQFGLLHANLWRTTDGTITGQGSNAEAADCFDTMSYCIADMNSHFNARYKNILNWITDANVQTVTASGTYRIFAQDATAPGGIRTLKIKKDDTKNYWVEFRQLFTGNSNAKNGAILHWDYSSQNFQETQLLDMNPTTSTVGDAPLLIGQSFYDSASQIKITVIGKGGTTPESLDVRVELNSGTTPALTYEGDVTPRGTIDGVVDATDVQQIERFSVGFDKPYLSNEGQRADCAPRTVNGSFVGGDGVVDATDVQQAERYSIGLDPKTLANGTVSVTAPESGSVSQISLKDTPEAATQRTLSIQSVSTNRGQDVVVNVLADIMGDETGYTFSLSYDSTKLTNPRIAKSAVAGETVLLNATTVGQIGFSVRNGNSAFPGGNGQVLVTVTFTVANAPSGVTPIGFTGMPAAGRTTDVNAQPLKTNYVDGTVTINPPTAAMVSVGGRVMTTSGRGIRKVVIIMTDSQGNQRRATTTSFGYYHFANVQAGEIYVFVALAKRFAFSQQSQVLNINEDTETVNFIANPYYMVGVNR